MKLLRNVLLSAAIALIAAVPSQAYIKQVTTLTNSAVATILTPGPACRYVVIQNNGSNNIRVSIDGGTANGGVDPTTSTGIEVQHGSQLIIVGTGSTGSLKLIRAIMETGTTTLDISTDDTASR